MYDYKEYRRAERLEEKREENIISCVIVLIFAIAIFGFYKMITLV